jgi:hypothetical protein
MVPHDVEPQLGAHSFSCPHCNAVAHQDWFSLFLKPENATDVVVLIPENWPAPGSDDTWLSKSSLCLELHGA